MQKPREFWLEKVETEESENLACWNFKPPFDGEHSFSESDFINVIEKSAYDELKAKAEKLVKALELYADRNNWKASRATAERNIFEYIEDDGAGAGWNAREALKEWKGEG